MPLRFRMCVYVLEKMPYRARIQCSTIGTPTSALDLSLACRAVPAESPPDSALQVAGNWGLDTGRTDRLC